MNYNVIEVTLEVTGTLWWAWVKDKDMQYHLSYL